MIVDAPTMMTQLGTVKKVDKKLMKKAPIFGRTGKRVTNHREAGRRWAKWIVL